MNTKEKGWRNISVIILLLVIILLFMLGLRVYKLLPAKYIVIYIAGACLVILFFVFLTLKAVNGMKSGIAVILFMIIVSAVLFAGHNAIEKAQSTIDKVTSGAEEITAEMGIYVLADSGITEISELKEFIVGYLSIDSEYADKVKEEINKILGTEPNYVEFDDVFSLVDVFYAKTVNVIIIDKAYIDVVSDVEGYETFADDLREIYSSQIVDYINVVDESEKKELNSFVVYISGIDRFGAVSARSRSDVNLLLAVNTQTKKIQMINTPRDSYVPLANSNGVKDKLTHAGIYGVDNSIKTLEMLYDIEIDYYIRMNFSGFEAIIDALGGIDVYSEYDFTVEPIKHYVKGMNHLTGLEALAFARERHSFQEGDFQRGRNQMAVVKATIEKVLSKEIIYSYSDLFDSVSGTFQTNMTSEEIYSLVRMQLADMATWEMTDYTVTGTGGRSTTYSMPNQSVYVLHLDSGKVEEAKNLLKHTLEGK